MHPIFDQSRSSLYIQLADLFEQRISRGVWPVGTRLPSFEELAREFDVARVTVRQAIGLLAKKGMLSPQRGRGTFVIAEEKTERWMRVETSLKNLADNYRKLKPQLRNVVEDTEAPHVSAEEGSPAEKYFHMLRVHSIRDVPYCTISIHLDQRIFQKAPRRFRRELVIPLLLELKGVKISRARQTLTISRADAETAGLLRIPVNAPVGLVRRVFNAPDNSVIYVADVTYRGDFIRLEMDLMP